mgnify:FL=1
MYEELRGQGDTRIYVWGMEQGELLLCVSTDNPRRFNTLIRTVPTLQRYSGSVLRFPVSLLDAVAEVIKAKKKRHLSEEAKKVATERLARMREQKKTSTNNVSQPPKTDDLSTDGS